MTLPLGTVTTAAGTSLQPAPQGSAGLWQTTGSPPLLGDQDEESWDAQLARWLPASPPELSPTGTQYAYAGSDGVHLVTPAQASDRLVSSTGSYQVLGWSGESILLVANLTSGGSALYKLNPGSGHLTTLSGGGLTSWYAVGGGAVWGSAVNPADPSPPPLGAGDEILRYDLSSGTTSTWSYSPGSQVTVVGVTGAGDPIEVVATASQTVIQLATAPATATPLLRGAGLGSLMPLEVASSITDTHGTWMGTDSGLYLLTPQQQLLLERPGNFVNAAVVGACS